MSQEIRGKRFLIIKNYRYNAMLRASFNELARSTFGIDFEPWYQNGYWTDNYQPYSIVDGNCVVANVSVNRTNMLYNGKILHLIQLGTVMTNPEYRNQGLIRIIMEEIEKDYCKEADGWYLWANDSVLDFYPKFGFLKSKEYQYWKEVTITEEASIRHLKIVNLEQIKEIETTVTNAAANFRFQTVENVGLTMFYLAGFMQEQIYYDEQSGTYVIAEMDNGNLFIYGVYSAQEVDLDKLINMFGKEVNKVTLGFTPLCKDGYHCKEIDEEDRTFFIKGDLLNLVANEKLMFPELGHA